MVSKDVIVNEFTCTACHQNCPTFHLLLDFLGYRTETVLSQEEDIRKRLLLEVYETVVHRILLSCQIFVAIVAHLPTCQRKAVHSVKR